MLQGVVSKARTYNPTNPVYLPRAYHRRHSNMRSARICTRNDVFGNLAMLFAGFGVFGTSSSWLDSSSLQSWRYSLLQGTGVAFSALWPSCPNQQRRSRRRGGPTPMTSAAQQVGSHLGYTGRTANVVTRGRLRNLRSGLRVGDQAARPLLVFGLSRAAFNASPHHTRWSNIASRLCTR